MYEIASINSILQIRTKTKTGKRQKDAKPPFCINESHYSSSIKIQRIMYANHFIQKLKGTPIPPGILLTNDEIKIARII